MEVLGRMATLLVIKNGPSSDSVWVTVTNAVRIFGFGKRPGHRGAFSCLFIHTRSASFRSCIIQERSMAIPHWQKANSIGGTARVRGYFGHASLKVRQATSQRKPSEKRETEKLSFPHGFTGRRYNEPESPFNAESFLFSSPHYQLTVLNVQSFVSSMKPNQLSCGTARCTDTKGLQHLRPT
jgi:hypothetical protein